MTDNAFLPSHPCPDQQVLGTGAVLQDLDVLSVDGECHLLDRLLKQGIEVNGDQDTGSEAGDCSPVAASCDEGPSPAFQCLNSSSLIKSFR